MLSHVIPSGVAASERLGPCETAAPTLITVGDNDMLTLQHAVRFYELRGGNVNADFVGLPASQLAVFPGTTHFTGLGRTTLVIDTVTGFLDA